MSLKLIKNDYPLLSEGDLTKIDSFVRNKCSEYYFIDYLRCTKGNVKDAIQFYKFDDKLRSLLIQFIIRFEIQIKTDFVRKLYKYTQSDHFWKAKEFYLASALLIKNGKKSSQYFYTVEKIEKEYNRYKFKTPGPLNYIALSFCSLGSFHSLYKYIDLKYKKDFIDMYTRDLPLHNFNILNSYISAIRIIRNRCAHGNHIVTLKIKNQLSNLSVLIDSTHNPINNISNLQVFDVVIYFLLKRLTCRLEFKSKLEEIFMEYHDLLVKYNGFHPFSTNIFKIISACNK